MKRKTFAKLAALLMALVMLLTLFPAAVFAEDGQDDYYDPYEGIEPTWQNYIESITPVGGAPYVSIKLTPQGYVFDDWYMPAEFDVLLKSGETKRATRVKIPETEHLPGWPEDAAFFIDGDVIEYLYEVDAGEEVITLEASLWYLEDPEQFTFSLLQIISEERDDEFGHGTVRMGFPIMQEDCETSVDHGSVITRLVWRIRQMIERIRSILWLFW